MKRTYKLTKTHQKKRQVGPLLPGIGVCTASHRRLTAKVIAPMTQEGHRINASEFRLITRVLESVVLAGILRETPLVYTEAKRVTKLILSVLAGPTHKQHE